MYNRYTPASDGSYSRRRVPNQTAPVPRDPPSSNPSPEPAPQKLPQTTQPSAAGFLKKLLPKEFDTGDLLILLLLLIMAGDSQEEQNSALLTLAIYFFL